MVEARRPVRPVPNSLREHYLAEGWWSDDTLGSLVERSLQKRRSSGCTSGRSCDPGTAPTPTSTSSRGGW